MQKITKPRFNRDGVRECFARIAVPFLLPHIMFAHLFASGKEKFLGKLIGKQNREDQLEQFWNELERRGDPRLDNHPMTRRPGWRRKAIPFAVHGDAVPVVAVGKAGTKSLDCVSIYSVLAKGSSMTIQWWVFALRLQKCAPETSDAAWKVLVWSLVAMFRGCHPASKWDDEAWDVGTSERMLGDSAVKLADGFFGIVWSIKGDLDWLSNEFGMMKYRENADPCDWCPCSKIGHPSNWPHCFNATSQ
jgi:hypothetical protein